MLILFHSFYRFSFLGNLVCFVLNQEVLCMDPLSQELLVSPACWTLSSCCPSPPQESRVWSSELGTNHVHFGKNQQETLKLSHTQDYPWPIFRNPGMCFRTGRPANYSDLKREDRTLQQPGSPAMAGPRAHPAGPVTQRSDQGTG